SQRGHAVRDVRGGETGMRKRAPWLLLAAVAHALLVVLVWFLFPFLRGDTNPQPARTGAAWWACDVLLVAQFAVLHSALLTRTARGRLERCVPKALHGCVFCTVTCLSLLLLLLTWQTSPLVLYRVEGPARSIVQGCYLLSWVGLAYSLSLTGLG